MKYTFELKVFLTYSDKELEVELDLSDEEVAEIKQLVADYLENKEEPEEEEDDEGGFVQEDDLLTILDDGGSELFDKFWDKIYPIVYKECLIDGIENGDEERLEEIEDAELSELSYKKLHRLYGDCMELDHDSCCLVKIPEALK